MVQLAREKGENGIGGSSIITKGVCISDSVAVKVLVILAGLEASILFLDKEERRSLGGFGQTDFPGVKIFINEFICGFLFLDLEGIEFLLCLAWVGLNIDSVACLGFL